MAKQFVRGIVPGGYSYPGIFCLDEETADVIDSFVDMNEKNNHDNGINFPKGEDKEVLFSFFDKIKEQLQHIKSIRETKNRGVVHPSSLLVSSTSINNKWAYCVILAWTEKGTQLLLEESPKMLLQVCRSLSKELARTDEFKASR